MFLSNDDARAVSFEKRATPVFKAAPELVNVLRPLLADVYAFTIATQGAHWNVQGADFAQYHELFSEIYEDVSGSIDPLAENILKVGGLAVASMSGMQSMRTTTDPAEERDCRALAAGLAVLNDALLMRINAAFDVATMMDEQGVANFLAERDDMHKKWRWQLRSSLGEPVVAKAAELKVGDFYSWDSSGGVARGRVERVVAQGSLNVPDSSFTIRAADGDPAVLLRVYQKGPRGWVATDTRVGHKASTLTRIERLSAS